MSKSSDAIVKEAREAIADSYEADRHNRQEMAIDLRFLGGDQWPDSVRRERDLAKRPMLTINLLPQFVRQIANEIRQSDIAIKVAPVDDGSDPKLAKIYNGILRQIHVRSNARHVYANAAESQIGCGVGYFRITSQYANDDGFDQELLIKRIKNPLSVYCDPGIVELDGSDMSYCGVTEMIPRKAFKARFPKASEVDIDVSSDSTSAFFWATADAIRVAEYWKREEVDRTIGLTQDGKTIDITDLPREMIALIGITRTRKSKGHKVRQWLVSGEEILEGPTEWAGSWIPIVRVIGDEVPLENVTVVRGVVRPARDPQQMYNFQMSAAVESVGLAPKSPWLVTPTMVGPHKAQWDAANTSPRPYLVYTPDDKAPGGAPKREHPPETPAALINMVQIAQDQLKGVTGIYDASLGAQGNETSGRAIRARQMEGDTANFHFRDNLEASLSHAGRMLIELIPKVYDTERVIRIMGEDDAIEEYVKVNTIGRDEYGMQVPMNDLSTGNFDVKVVIGQSFATKRAESAEAMMQFIQALPNAAPVVGDLIAKNMDWPGSEEIAKRLRNMVPPQFLADHDDPNNPPPPPPNPMDDPQIASKVALTEQQARKTAAEATEKEAQLGSMMTMFNHPQMPQGPAEERAEGPAMHNPAEEVGEYPPA